MRGFFLAAGISYSHPEGITADKGLEWPNHERVTRLVHNRCSHRFRQPLSQATSAAGRNSLRSTPSLPDTIHGSSRKSKDQSAIGRTSSIVIATSDRTVLSLVAVSRQSVEECELPSYGYGQKVLRSSPESRLFASDCTSLPCLFRCNGSFVYGSCCNTPYLTQR